MSMRSMVMACAVVAGCGGDVHIVVGAEDGGAPDLTTTGPGADMASGGRALKNVFIILMENNNWSNIKGSPSAPYINGLLKTNAHAEMYFNPPGIHPSEPNYLWMEAGTNFQITDDAPPAANHQKTSAHLAALLNTAGISWRAYQEDISGTNCPLTSVKRYAPKHNPFVFFDDLTGSLDPKNADCIKHNRPLTELAGDLTNDTAARYNFITPNLCNDMHDNCAPINDGIKQGDTWLSQNVPPLLASRAYQDGGVLFITWDESEGGDFPIGMIVLSPAGKGGGYVNQIAYTHGSLLRSLQEIFDVKPLLGDAANQTNLGDLFKVFP